MRNKPHPFGIKKQARLLVWLGVCVLWGSGLVAQDIHFTQFFTNPLALNPAQTGYFNGNYRVGGQCQATMALGHFASGV
jgi:hypothetical protein